MDTSLKLKVALDSLKKAKSYKRNSNYGRAFAHYLVYFELVDKKKRMYEEQFVEVLCMWGKVLQERNQIENLCKCYLQALNYFPLNIEILNNFSTHLIRISEYEEAKRYLQLAHNLSPNYLPAEKHLMTVKGELIERWHFPMLNDYERNMAYYKAILSCTCEDGGKVIDIGTGCGLLSLFASNNENVRFIHAVEGSKVMSLIASDVFDDNNMTKVKLHNKYSTELSVIDIEGHANLLITEIFDVGLFGENALETLIHAWENLLDKNAKIVPASASLYITGIECNDLLRSYKLLNTSLQLNLKNICATVNTDEPYESINTKLLSYKPVTETKNILNVDFSNLTQLKNLEMNKNHFDVQTLKTISAGHVDAFVIWFDLHLDENNTITTNPNLENVNCWEQAVAFIKHPSICTIDTDIELEIQCYKGQLQINIVNSEETCTNCFKVSSEIISFINDEVLVSVIEELYDNTLQNKDILDTFPFPILGLKYARNNNKCYCIAKTALDKLFIEYVCDINNIHRDNVIIMTETMHNCAIGDRSYKYDIILLDMVCRNGTISESSKQNYDIYKTCLNPGGELYPKALNIICQVIESDYLCKFNVVNDENSFGFRIASHINKYSVNEHFDLDKNFRHKKLSKAECVSNMLVEDETESLVKCKQYIRRPSNVDGILYWFEIEFCNGISFDTSSSTHYKYACFLINRQDTKDENNELTLCMKQHRGLIKIYLETCFFVFVNLS